MVPLASFLGERVLLHNIVESRLGGVGNAREHDVDFVAAIGDRIALDSISAVLALAMGRAVAKATSVNSRVCGLL